jgi:colicin import membrane protein
MIKFVLSFCMLAATTGCAAIHQESTGSMAGTVSSAAIVQSKGDLVQTVGLYRGLIAAKVRGNTHLPENLEGNPEVRCLVKLLPSGEVLRVGLTKSSGNVAYDKAVVSAIMKSSPLPLPSDRDVRAVFLPELSFILRPKE